MIGSAMDNHEIIQPIFSTFASVRWSTIILLLFLVEIALGQSPCATMEKTENALYTDSAYKSSMLEQVDLLEQFESGVVDVASRNVKQVTLPVVVHVLYESEEQNIPVEQIHSQIDVLNRDFGWNQSDKQKIPSIWRDLGRDSGIRFKLADVDPDGNFTTGITRKQIFQSDIGNGDNYYQSSLGGTDPWPRPHYINIWVCEIGDNVLGYTFLPVASFPVNDGIVIDPRAFGTTGAAVEPYNGGRTMVHEMGHYLGLRHTWGMEEGECTNTDYMSDTPWQREPNFGCSRFPHVSCASEPNGDMFMNFMDYADDTCALLFTKRQVKFMQLVLQTSRVGLIHSPAITHTDEVDNHKLRVYPNPVDGRLLVDGLQNGISQYDLFTDTGLLIRTGNISASNSQVSFESLSNGIYLLQIGSEIHRIVHVIQ